jgi:hypothetical protein
MGNRHGQAMGNLKFKIMKILYLSVLLLFGVVGLFAQSEITLLNSRPVDPDRNDQIKGSPYIFKDWVKADITPTAGLLIEGVDMNFNGYSRQFEIRKGKEFIELEERDFVSITLSSPDESCSTVAFLKYPHSKLNNQYPLFVYNGNKYQLLKDFRVTLVENKVEAPGGTKVFKTFNDVYSYYLKEDQSLTSIKLNKKDLLEKFNLLGVEAYIKSEKLNLSTESGVCQLVSWVEKQD